MAQLSEISPQSVQNGHGFIYCSYMDLHNQPWTNVDLQAKELCHGSELVSPLQRGARHETKRRLNVSLTSSLFLPGDEMLVASIRSEHLVYPLSTLFGDPLGESMNTPRQTVPLGGSKLEKLLIQLSECRFA